MKSQPLAFIFLKWQRFIAGGNIIIKCTVLKAKNKFKASLWRLEELLKPFKLLENARF